MNAAELYEAAFDSANEYAEPTAQYVANYASGAFDMEISADQAEAVAEARREWLALVAEGNADSNKKFHRVTKPLEAIEL